MLVIIPDIDLPAIRAVFEIVVLESLLDLAHERFGDKKGPASFARFQLHGTYLLFGENPAKISQTEFMP